MGEISVSSSAQDSAHVAAAPATSGGKALAWAHLLRPQQWIKSAFVLAPLLFSGRAGEPEAQWRAVSAFLLFCVVSSAAYAFNDVMDRARDRAHPLKRRRPVATGLIAPAGAIAASIILGGAALAVGWVLSPSLGAVLGSYLALNVVYGALLKKVVILDVFAIAAFFVLRLLAGAAAVDVTPSVWLLLCGGLLALYLGFAKRRHELELLGHGSAEHRDVLSQYSVPFLDQLSLVLLSVTIVSYIMYTIESETAKQVGSQALAYSTAFVLYGVLRYLYLVHRRDGGNPTETLLTDRSLLVAVLLWVVYCGLVIYLPS